jgi:hypothetical protein
MCVSLAVSVLVARTGCSVKVMVKVKFTKAQSGSRDIALLFLQPRRYMGTGGHCRAPAVLPPENTRYPLYRRLGGPQGRSGRVRKIAPSPGFDPWTVPPLASHYTDWATPAHTGCSVARVCHRCVDRVSSPASKTARAWSWPLNSA